MGQKKFEGGKVKNFEVGVQNLVLYFFDLYEAYILNLGPIESLEPFKKFSVGGWWVVVVVYSEFSVLLWSKAFVLDLDQAEQ